MYGRYSVYESMDHYLRELGPQQPVVDYVPPRRSAATTWLLRRNAR